MIKIDTLQITLIAIRRLGSEAVEPAPGTTWH
jgi:hypothetical protein